MAIGGVVINFKAVTDAAVREVRSLTRSLDDTDRKAKDVDRSHSNLGRNLKAGLAAGAAAAGAALVGVGAAMIQFAEAAIADNKAAETLADTLRTIPGITDAMIDANSAWIDSMEIATGVADDDMRVAISKLALATGDLTEAQRLTALSADVAAGSGKDFAAVSDAMAKAAAGNTAQLKRQFPWLDANNDGTVTLSEATEGLGKAYTGAAEAAQDRDPWNRLLTIWGQLKEQLGQWVLPLIDRFGEWFKNPENKKAIQNLITRVGELARGLGDDLVPKLEEFLAYLSSGKWKNALGNTAEDFKTVAKAVIGLVQAIAKVIGWMQTLYGWMKKLDNWTTPSWFRGGGINWSDWPWSRSAGGTATPTVSTRSATPAPRMYTGAITINVNGAESPYETARVMKRALEGYDVAQGRKPWTPLAPAW